MWHFAKNWELWAGQTKLPGNVERVISSGDLQLVDRSLLNKDRLPKPTKTIFYLKKNFLTLIMLKNYLHKILKLILIFLVQ